MRKRKQDSGLEQANESQSTKSKKVRPHQNSENQNPNLQRQANKGDVSLQKTFGRVLQDISNRPHTDAGGPGGSGNRHETIQSASQSSLMFETPTRKTGDDLTMFSECIQATTPVYGGSVNSKADRTKISNLNRNKAAVRQRTVSISPSITGDGLSTPVINKSRVPRKEQSPLSDQRSNRSVTGEICDEDEQMFDCSSGEDSLSDSSDIDMEDETNITKDVLEGVNIISNIAKNLMNQYGSVQSPAPLPNKQYSSEYLDHGDPVYTCEHCQAIFWYGERLNNTRNSTKPVYGGCCLQGQVKLPFLTDCPELLHALLTNDDRLSRHFRKNIRAYNMIFSFTSLGGKVENCTAKGRGPQMFQLQGENYHRMGSLKPTKGPPKFSQMYIVDTENEVENRSEAMSNGNSAGKYKKKQELRKELIDQIIKMLNDVNPYVGSFRAAKDRMDTNPDQSFHMRIVSDRLKDGRTYSMPTATEVAALIPGDFIPDMPTRDIVVEEKTGKLKRISEVHISYLALQYPLLFPRGEDGFRPGIPKTDTGRGKKKSKKPISMRQWYAYRIQERKHESQILLRSKRLFQQFLVDAFTSLECNRIGYLKLNQSSIRAANYDSVQEASTAGNVDLNDSGKAYYLPATFLGGPRYMRNMYLDAMAVCKRYGFPDLFITFTCNPKWPEINRFCEERKLDSDDRPDVICRIFKMKLDSLIDDLTRRELLGKTVCYMYTIEFQKRGLPHAHILLWMDSASKFKTADDIDKVISAEIPDKVKDPALYEIVKDMMIHGPCGARNMNSPCMEEGKCSKFFPKKLTPDTIIDKEGFPIYRRRETGRFVEKNGFKLDNSYVIPYNRILLLRYGAHINVEWCTQTGSVKYLFKYILKGPDMISVVVEPANKSAEATDGQTTIPTTLCATKRNEIQDFFDCRYVSACEAAWRLLKFHIHHRSVAVQRLSFHLPGKHLVYFKGDDHVETVLNRNSLERTMFTAWFDLNEKCEEARQYTYEQIPEFFTYDSNKKMFKRRQRKIKAIGRINHVPRKIEAGYFMRVLLNHQTGPKSFDDLKTVNGVVYKTYKEACYALGLLENDQEYIDDLVRSSLWGTGGYLRDLFVILLQSDTLTQPEIVWEHTWEILSEDIQSMKRKLYNRPELILSDEEKKLYALEEIEKLLKSRGSSLASYATMPDLPEGGISSTNALIIDEKDYDRDELQKKHDEWVETMTNEQKKIYDAILDAVYNEKGGVFFVYGYGGTGKTFLWRTISAAIRSKGHIVLNVASSGIASLLLEGGRTAHSRFGIPINPDEFTTCSMQKGSDQAELMKESKLIIWDEAPMMSKHCFESLDRSLNDIIGRKENQVFGGKVVVFGGDFRQILPVINGAGRTEIVMASLNSSYLWEHCKVFNLTKNMRLMNNKLSEDEAVNVKAFSDWILRVGDGKVSEPNDGEALIDIPEEFLITDSTNPIKSITTEVYGNPNQLEEELKPEWWQERAILAPTNEDVNIINQYMLDQLKGEERVFLSSDTIDPSDTSSVNNPVLNSDFLNSIKLSGLPNHELRLKIGAPVMLLRNIDPKGGLMNGTRLQITQMDDFMVEARVITGDRVGDKVVIPRLLITPSDVKMPFKMRRRQLPLAVAFAMTINKSQGQSLEKVGLYLPRPCFSHGQLYVAISRVTSKKGLKMLILNKEGKPQKKTKNVVFKEVFRNL